MFVRLPGSERPTGLLQKLAFTDSFQDNRLDYSALERIKFLCDGTILARDLANEQADVAHPVYLAQVAQQLSQDYGMKVSKEKERVNTACCHLSLSFLLSCPF